MGMNKWQINRAGLFNFWYYDQGEFQFSAGKLLLRGLNGSGKSVTMQSLVTVLLDGKISANRLDPFGSRDRRMEDYLLGERDVVDREERTGYLYLEYKRQNSDQYVTTGIGLRAKRGSALDFWGFIVTDSRRVNRDLLLYKTEYSAVDGKEEKIPLTRPELERLIGTGGQVVRSQREYMNLVNKYVFGFSSLDAYKDLMELLIQLRSPKLSKDFKPSVIHEILTDSLPTLTEEELRPLSDVIENIEQTKQQIDQLERDRSALQRLSRQYDAYNLFILVQKADELTRASQRFNRSEQSRRTCLKEQQEKVSRCHELAEDLTALERLEAVLRQEETELKDHDVFKMEKQKQSVAEEVRALNHSLTQNGQRLQEKQRSEQREKQQMAAAEQAVDAAENEMLECMEDLGGLASEGTYQGHASAVREFERSYGQKYSFKLWKQELTGYQQKLNRILGQLRNLTAAKKQQEFAGKEADEARQAFDEAREAVRQAETALFTAKEELLGRFYQWVKEEQTVLPMEAEEIRSATLALQNLPEESSWQDVLQSVDVAYQRQYGQHLTESHRLQQKMEQAESEKQVLQAELADWKGKKDPEPFRPAAVMEARQKLAEDHIPAVPFYAAVEFQHHVQPKQRERIEAALTEMGLLDALIVPHSAWKSLDKDVYDQVIHPEPAILSATLADYLEPALSGSAGVTAGDVDEVLRSILIDDTINYLSDAGSVPVLSVSYGSYCSGLVTGRAPLQDEAKFIGFEARHQYRLREIERLEEELAAYDCTLSQLATDRRFVQDAIDHLQAARAGLPAPDGVLAVYDQLREKRQNSQVRDEDLHKKDARYRAAVDKSRSLSALIKQQAGDISLLLQEELFEAALASLREYERFLHQLELTHQRFQADCKNLDQSKIRLAENQADVDRLRGEQLVLEGNVKTKQLQLENFTQRLADLGAEKIMERSNFVIRRLGELPTEIKQLAEERARTELAAEQLAVTASQLAAECEFFTEIVTVWQQAFDQEAQLHLIDGGETLTAAEVLKQHGSVLKNDDRDKATTRISESFYRELSVLMEYRLTLDEIFSDTVLPEKLTGVEDENLALYVASLRQNMRRQRILLEYDSRKAAPAVALSLMDKQIEMQKLIQSQQDRELYEEVILNSIGRVISKRIQNAELWAGKMNDLMSKLDTSSNLSFSLRWRPLTADNDEQLDTEELVELLRSDHRLLKEEDMNKLIAHFRSRIDQAKAAAVGQVVTFQRAIQEVLDFRRWFTFTLYYRRGDSPKKELTNSAFGKFSGGEKAMAMYVPLFSAAYSQYQGARDDAPYIISLDEAFAGVDENNIKEMFDLVEKLGFNYIMNSQSLWGDYDTVSRLAIYELVRPKNAPFVTLVPYLWDGKTRSLAVNEDG
ncbi:hypothetical protein Ga0466249_001849 [Sporomusaceae bacterium BoRhaA]|uniref:TIGR02680 family protein n=1 Tax=Pelorhabdus rhamnosifermentans TaxID=2772457 RepID=UPI001C05F688|nr:TIGR02680 family protein [Pelorhabdus rhamnosifermentans]MBU2700744.1 hypothetical protein [Pelorhabdus rhamnosifermentans]